MPEFRKIGPHERPSPYSNHVLIERTKETRSVVVTGASNNGPRGVDYLSPTICTDLDSAISASEKWAQENGVSIIYVLT